MKTILLLSCGTNACYHIAKTLKEKFIGKFRIVGTDINLQWMIPTAPYLDEFYQCPYTADSGYYSFILSICKKERVDFLIPSFDADQNLFYSENPELSKIGTTSFGISREIKEIYNSKVSINKYLNTIGIPTPKVYTIAEVCPDCDYFVKPKNGVGSIGAKIVKGAEILKFFDPNLIIQEICKDPEVTLECFNYNNEIYSVARIRLGCKAGVCTKTKIYQDNELTKVARKLANSIKLPHIFNLQFMKNTEGKYVVTDVNLRTAGGMSLSNAAGWDEVSALAKIMLREDDILSTVNVKISDQYVIRAYTDIVTKQVSKRIGFDLDGTLLDSRFRHEHLMNDILIMHNIDINADGLIQFKSTGKNNLDWLKEKGIEDKVAKMINEEWVSNIETSKYLNDDTLYPHVIQMLQRLSKNNSLFLITARTNHKAVLEQIEKLGIKQYFDCVFVVPSGKSASILKSEYIKNNKIDIFVGDTEVDMLAAKSVGCRFEVCMDGFRSHEYWSQFDVPVFNEQYY